MNFFFGINSKYFNSELQIPRFRNRKPEVENISLYQAYCKDNSWIYKNIDNCLINKNFFIVKNELIQNDKIFF